MWCMENIFMIVKLYQERKRKNTKFTLHICTHSHTYLESIICILQWTSKWTSHMQREIWSTKSTTSMRSVAHSRCELAVSWATNTPVLEMQALKSDDGTNMCWTLMGTLIIIDVSFEGMLARGNDKILVFAVWDEWSAWLTSAASFPENMAPSMLPRYFW